MGMTIDDIKHCLKVMVDCEVCEECNLYGTTGTDHCEHDCVCGALDIINKYQKMQKVLERIWNIPSHLIDKEQCLDRIMETYREVRVEDGKID